MKEIINDNFMREDETLTPEGREFLDGYVQRLIKKAGSDISMRGELITYDDKLGTHVDKVDVDFITSLMKNKSLNHFIFISDVSKLDDIDNYNSSNHSKFIAITIILRGKASNYGYDLKITTENSFEFTLVE